MTVHHSHRSWRQEREHSFANRAGDGGEIMRACQAYAAKVKAERDAQVRHPASIPCTTCRRPTLLSELRGGPGRWSCTACEAPAPEPEPQPNPGASAPQPIEDDEMSRATKAEQEQRRQQALELRREGLTQTQIAERLGVSTTTVCSDLRLLEAAGEELPPNHTPPGREPQEDLHGEIRELIAQGLRHGEIVRQTGASRVMVSRVIRQSRGLPPYQSGDGRRALRAEIESLRNTLRETEEGAAELLEELEQLRASPAAASQIAALKGGVAQIERERLDLARQLLEAQTAHTLALTAAEDLRRAADAQAVDARAALASAQREVEELRAQLAAAEEAARRPPEARRAEVERLELELAALRETNSELHQTIEHMHYQLAARSNDSIWIKAWESEVALRNAEARASAAERVRQQAAATLERAQRELAAALDQRDTAREYVAEVQQCLPAEVTQ